MTDHQAQSDLRPSAACPTDAILNASCRPSAAAARDTHLPHVAISADPATSALLLRLARWIANHATPNHMDHACVECVPHGGMVVTGFRCAVHEARATLARNDPSAGGPAR